jgi:glycosyltransferase involved in cell wall biosynthesis
MFMRVAERVLSMRSDVEFRCLVTPGGMSDEWNAFGTRRNVQVLHNLSAREVLRFYQEVDVLVLPLNETTANNAIVEAMSCGTPVLSTSVGGIASYGGGTVFPVVKNDDDEALYARLCELLDDHHIRTRVGAACRSFAERELDWQLVSARHSRFYEVVARNVDGTVT